VFCAQSVKSFTSRGHGHGADKGLLLSRARARFNQDAPTGDRVYQRAVQRDGKHTALSNAERRMCSISH